VLNHTMRAVGGLLVLIVATANVQVYFLSQVLLTLVGLLITAYALYHALPAGISTNELTNSNLQKLMLRFNLERFNACKRFAAGMAITSTCVFFIMQTDKIILTKLVSLEQFGYYTVAISIAATIAGAAGIISRSILPRMTQLVALNETEALKTLYIKSSSFVAWLVLPIAGLLIVFNQQFLTLYLGNIDRVAYIAPVFALLMFGYAVHSLMYIPYALTLAHGWTRYGINTSIVVIVAMTPITILATLKYGVIGAASAWVVLSLGYLCFSIKYLHQKIHKDWMWSFYGGISLQLLILVLCCASLLLKR
jgi:O-antigen/teichoic acid export membrane protein